MNDLLLGGMIMLSTGVIIRECSDSQAYGLCWAGSGAFLLIWNILLQYDII